MKKSLLIAMILMSTSVVPIVATADIDDIFNCSKNGQSSASAGSTEPLRGPYVPVSDYAVTLNTGLLVYKECVLRVIATAKARAALAATDNKVLTQFNTGNNGRGHVSQELGKETSRVMDDTMRRYLYGDGLSNFNDSIENKVKNAIARGYTAARDPRNSFKCDYKGDLNQLYAGTISPQEDYWTGFDLLVNNPACNVFGAANIGTDALQGQYSYEAAKYVNGVNNGRGVIPVTYTDAEGRTIIATPGDFVNNVAQESLLSGYRQAQRADDIGEMVDAMYLGVVSQSLLNGGIAALTQALGGNPSYMQQVVQSASNGYNNTTKNATIAALQAALTTERQYNGIISTLVNLFTQTIASLRSKETQCYAAIAESICQQGSVSSSSCTSLGGGTLTISKSTAFSQKVIDANIRASATAAVTNLNGSNQIAARIQELIVGLGTNPSQALQQAALAALNALRPHTGSDVSSAQQNQQSVSTLMSSLISNTTTLWSDGEELPAGWCNVNRQEVKDAWTSCWSGSAASCPTP